MSRQRKFIWITLTRQYLIAFGLLVVLLYILMLPESYHLAVLSTAAVATPVKYDVVIDPGHGGIDSGGIGAEDIYEKEIVLDIALKMKDYLEKQGLTVGLTRSSDTDVTHLASIRGTRHQRDLNGRFLAMHEGSLGISIHANVTKSKDEKGAIVFYRRDSYIDRLYAETVLEELESVQVLNHPQPIPRGNLLLLKVKPPSLLVEVGFLSNQDDLEKLTNPDFRQVLAEALGQGVLNFYYLYRLEQSE